MSQAWPTDRKFVDKDGKIVDPWMGPLQQLKPLLKLTPADFVTLQTLIRAAQETEEEGVDVFDALPVNLSPDPASDFIIGYDGDAYKTPFSLVGRSALISSTGLSGNASVDVQIPSTYQHVKLFISGMSFSTTAEGQFSLSEDGGSTFLAAAFELFKDTSVHAATTGTTTPNLTASGGSGAAAVFSMVLDILNVGGSANKFVTIHATLDSSGTSYTGSYVFTSTNAVTMVRLIATAGTFDAGTVELWGMP
jgi:hypothetical protein